MFYRPSIGTSSTEFNNEISQTPIGSMSESEVSQFFTQVRFTNEEDTLLIQSWLNVSKDAIVGVDQKAGSVWLRVKESYNNYRWHKLNAVVQKFVECYKQAVQRKKSRSSEKDIMADAYTIFSQDEGEQFKIEHAWRLLKDEPKWRNDPIDRSSKRTKIYDPGSYSTSPNLNMPTSSQPEPASPLVRPMGEKAAKRKSKGKVIEISSSIIDLTDTEEAMKEKNAATNRVVATKETENTWKLYEILLTDTSEMSESQCQDHELYCQFIRRRLQN